MFDKLCGLAEKLGTPLPEIEEYEGPDPQWEAAVRGNPEALHNEIRFISSRLKTLSVELQSLSKGLKEHASRNTATNPTENDGAGCI